MRETSFSLLLDQGSKRPTFQIDRDVTCDGLFFHNAGKIGLRIHEQLTRCLKHKRKNPGVSQRKMDGEHDTDTYSPKKVQPYILRVRH